MVAFWRSVLLHEGRYVGDPRAVHSAIAGLRPSHFDRWLGLFADTLDDHFADDVASTIRAKAAAMARRLTSALGPRHDAFGPGQRT